MLSGCMADISDCACERLLKVSCLGRTRQLLIQAFQDELISQHVESDGFAPSRRVGESAGSRELTLSIVLGAKDCRSGHQGVGAHLNKLVCVGGGHTAVHLNPGVHALQ